MAEDGIVERSDVETSSECRFGLLPQPRDLALAGLVAKSLARPADVAVGLDVGVGLRLAGIEELRDGLLACPAEGVDAGIDYEPGRAVRLGVEHAEPFGLVEE